MQLLKLYMQLLKLYIQRLQLKLYIQHELRFEKLRSKPASQAAHGDDRHV